MWRSVPAAGSAQPARASDPTSPLVFKNGGAGSGEPLPDIGGAPRQGPLKKAPHAAPQFMEPAPINVLPSGFHLPWPSAARCRLHERQQPRLPRTGAIRMRPMRATRKSIYTRLSLALRPGICAAVAANDAAMTPVLSMEDMSLSAGYGAGVAPVMGGGRFGSRPLARIRGALYRREESACRLRRGAQHFCCALPRCGPEIGVAS